VINDDCTMKITILCGIPGSGKSTYLGKNLPNALICSADLYPGLYTYPEGPNNPTFNPSLLPKAHAACLRRFVGYVTCDDPQDAPDVVVDNTNTTIAEIAPYAALALAYGHELEIVTLACDPETGARRNTHGVPLAACQAMADRLYSRTLPPWWPTKIVASY
jgi:tRNA uridine 5-carbamoylmethylation protein Kti12